jgi:hypothetical protein
MISVRGSFSDGRMGPTKNAHSVRRVSLLYPTTEDRPEWSPSAAGIGPRHVLDGLQVLIATTADAEAEALAADLISVRQNLEEGLDDGGRPVPEAACPPAFVRLDPPESRSEPVVHRPGGRLDERHHPVEDLRALDPG